MYLKKLHLRNFRNYQFLDLAVHPQLNIFVGDNAQGKTNILESIYLLATGKSHRTNRDAELAKWGERAFLVKAEIERKPVPITIEILGTEGKKHLKINGREERFGSLLGKFNVVLFSPEDLQLVKGNPAERRRFLDQEISQTSPQYYYYLHQYLRILTQRNNCLKAVKERKASEEMMDIWDAQLIDTGAYVLAKRWEVVKKLNILARLMHRRLTDQTETLEINYLSSLGYQEEKSRDELKKIFAERLAADRQQEIWRCMTLSGPHRDDLILTVNGVNVRTYGSQGQQRTAALALKLAELEFIRSETGSYPVLLLDDVMSELDEMRRGHLVQTIKNQVQTFITTANLDYLPKLDDQLKIFRVSRGNVEGKQ